MSDRNPDDNVSKNPNASSPGQKPDQASPNPGGPQVQGDRLQPHPGQGAQIDPDEVTPGPYEQKRPGQPNKRSDKGSPNLGEMKTPGDKIQQNPEDQITS